jgi:hypothetical protein
VESVESGRNYDDEQSDIVITEKPEDTRVRSKEYLKEENEALHKLVFELNQ